MWEDRKRTLKAGIKVITCRPLRRAKKKQKNTHGQCQKIPKKDVYKDTYAVRLTQVRVYITNWDSSVGPARRPLMRTVRINCGWRRDSSLTTSKRENEVKVTTVMLTLVVPGKRH